MLPLGRVQWSGIWIAVLPKAEINLPIWKRSHAARHLSDFSFNAQRVVSAGLMSISSLTKLRNLNLWNCLRISVDGLKVLSELRGLTELSLRGCCQITDAAMLALVNLTNLHRLDLRACEKVTGMSPGW